MIFEEELLLSVPVYTYYRIVPALSVIRKYACKIYNNPAVQLYGTVLSFLKFFN